ncbi:MAG: tetratricopeptide repeat protein, partial [Armatimonadota bacterium]
MATLILAVGLQAQETHVQAGARLAQEGQLQQAKAELLEAYEDDPESPACLAWLGFVCLQLKQSDEAVRYLARAAEIDANDPIVQNNLGNAHFDTGDMEAAEEGYKAAIELKADYFEAHYNLANL